MMVTTRAGTRKPGGIDFPSAIKVWLFLLANQ